MSKTPRTEVFAQRLIDAKVPSSRSWPHWFDFSGKLETELSDLKAQFAEYVKAEILKERSIDMEYYNASYKVNQLRENLEQTLGL